MNFVKNVTNTILISGLALLVSCSTGNVSFTSNPPGADVFLLNDLGEKKILGQTPLQLNSVEIFSRGNTSAQVEIAKADYHSSSVVVTEGKFSTTTFVNANLKKDVDSQKNQKSFSQEDEETIAQSVAKANSLIAQKNYSEAGEFLKDFINKHPNISVSYDYLGNINYLQKNFAKALSYYNKAMEINPKNPERTKIIEKLKNLVGEEKL